MKISSMLLTSRSSRPRRVCLWNLRRRVMRFVGARCLLFVDRIRTNIWSWFTHHSPSVGFRRTFHDHLLERCLIVTLPLFQWFQLTVANRPKYSEDVTTLNDINDFRNRMFASTIMYNPFDLRCLVILKVRHIRPPARPPSDPCVVTNPQTPNHVLSTEPRHHRRHAPEDVKYPARSRYTLQWVVSRSIQVMDVIPNNSDATFKKGRNHRTFRCTTTTVL